MSSRPVGIILNFEMYAVDGRGRRRHGRGARTPSLSKLIITNKTVL